MPNVLKKLNAEVNRLQKKFPNKKRKTLQKEVGKKYRAGKLKKRKPRKVKAVRKTRKPRRKVGTVGRVKAPRRRRRAPVKTVVRTRTRTKTVYKARRVGASGKSKGLVLLAFLAVGAILLMKLMKPSTPPLVITNNPARNTTAQNILAYAAAAGATAAAIAKLIQQMNSSNDSQVAALNNAIQAAPDLSDDSKVNQILSNNANIAGYRLN